MRKTLLLLALFLLVAVPRSEAAFLHYESVTVDHTKAGTADTANFPALISGTYVKLKTAANGGEVLNASGYDVGFYTNPNCSTGKMSWETETYAAATGVVNYWVLLANLSHTADTVFYMCWGNSAITTDQSSKTAVWDTNFKGVYHFPDGTTLGLGDSTSNAYNGTQTSMSAATGKIDGGVSSAAASPGNVDVATFANFARPGTFEFWLNVPASQLNKTIYQANSYSGNGILYTRNFSSGSELSFYVSGADEFSTDGIVDGTPHYVDFIIDGSGNRSIYIDGVAATVNNVSGTVTAFNTSTHINFLGGLATPDATYLDEFRISNTNRTTSYITASYNNEKTPSTFYTLGSEINRGFQFWLWSIF